MQLRELFYGHGVVAEACGGDAGGGKEGGDRSADRGAVIFGAGDEVQEVICGNGVEVQVDI